MHSSDEESDGDGEPVEEVQQVHSVRCLLTWYDSVRTRYGKLAARPSESEAELTDREKLGINAGHAAEHDIADINMVLDGREDPVAPVATQTTTSPEQVPPSSTGGKEKTIAQKMKEQDAAFFSHMKERTDATAQFRAEIMATAVTPIISSPKKLDSSRTGFCNWFESVV
ncbi:unnamed protein product [Mytilus coruscus]|uniref:Uncharacterized protein n=1 Tax=Mytilus coruscus TaxID=42192 RepID=A0A6J8D1D4_MYTCO|nr:unnamed protein product [Mytilus coruscus]